MSNLQQILVHILKPTLPLAASAMCYELSERLTSCLRTMTRDRRCEKAYSLLNDSTGGSTHLITLFGIPALS